MANPNRIRIEHDIIVIVIKGRQTFDIADKTYKSVQSKIQKLKLQKKPVHILADLTGIDGHDTAARTRIKDFFKLDYDKLAYFGAKSYKQNLVLYLAGPRNNRVRPFKKKEAAVSWLTDGNEPLFSMKEPTPSSARTLVFLLCVTGILITLVVCVRLYNSSVSVSQRQAVDATADASDATAAKINTYLTTLYGFKAYFAACENVSRADFHNYFAQLNLRERLPGITAIAYIREVPQADAQAVIDEVRGDSSLPDHTQSEFTIKNPEQQPTYYPIVYLEPLAADSGTYGTDLGTYPGRVATLTKARQTGHPVVSDSFKMMRAGKSTDRRGFFITIPVNGNHAVAPLGYINAIFDYDVLFANTRPLTGDAFAITDHTKQTVYTSDTADTATAKLASNDIKVADKTWHLYLHGNNSYGLSGFESLTPWVALVTGLSITALITFVLSSILRSRQSAFELAHYITEDLRVAEHTHDLMIDSVQDYAIYMLDKDGKVMTWNSGAALIHGYKTAEILGKHFSVFHRKGERRNANRELKQAVTKGRAENYGWRVRKDKTEFWAHVTLNTIRNEEGELLGFTKLTQDLTWQRRLEQERDSFVAIATHELKTPITSIKAYAQVLQRRFVKAGDERSAELLGRMDTQANKLTILVSDLLDVSKVETGRLEYDKKPFDIDALVSILAEDLGRTSLQHKITIKGRIGAAIVGDEYRIGQIITNLLENAIKYSPEADRITVSLRKYNKFAELRVRDFGPGIRQSDQIKIFEQFYRTSSGKQSPGFGLGLYISSQIASKHGGTLTVQSTPGRGATFTLRLPLHSPDGDAHD